MKIYLAGPWGMREFVAEVGAALEKMGHTITRKWYAWAPGDDDIDIQIELDKLGIVEAGILVAFITDEARSTFWECGYAQGLGKPVVVYLEKNVRCEFALYGRDVTHMTAEDWPWRAGEIAMQLDRALRYGPLGSDVRRRTAYAGRPEL